MTTGVQRVMRRVTPQQTDESMGTGNGGPGVWTTWYRSLVCGLG